MVSRLFQCLGLILAVLSASGAEPPLDFNRDIRPILSDHCFHCHGQDPRHREAKLRLDTREGATGDLGGHAAVVPGKPESSELVRRIFSTDPDDLMPPAKAHRPLTPAQAGRLKRWVAEGARYDKHWAFIPPRKPEAPLGAHSIDTFVHHRLAQEGLAPSPAASPEAWLRRVSLDLTGIPPTVAELESFLAKVQSRGEPAWMAEADRLLASPRFGERMAIDWLDAARYADTHGFNNDSARGMWRWRDWVIDAFNANLPYDRFITEQLAGDLLSSPTTAQRVATGFNRNHVINSEGGLIEEEYRVEYVADRVRTLSTAWLGLTMECARCHDHKYDPITQRDYYGLFAFFNNVPEHGEDGRIANAAPIFPAPTLIQQMELDRQEESLRKIDAQLGSIRSRFDARAPRRTPTDRVRTPPGLVLHLSGDETRFDAKQFVASTNRLSRVEGVVGMATKSRGGPIGQIAKGIIDLGKPVTVAFWVRPEKENPSDVALISNASYSGPPAQQQFGKGQEVRLIDEAIEVRASDYFPAYALRVRAEGMAIRPGAWRHVAAMFGGGREASSVRIFVDGREVPTRILYDGLTSKTSGAPSFDLGADRSKDARWFEGSFDEIKAFDRVLQTDEVRDLFLGDAAPWASQREAAGVAGDFEKSVLRESRLLAGNARYAVLVRERDALWERHLATRRLLPHTMVMEELNPPRRAYLLKRGAYDARGDEVQAMVPEQTVAPWPANAPRNRLGLAQWLTQPGHPLTSRVVVNRFWAQLFGVGLVKTLEDFGVQGEFPSHPELLDWLASEFIDNGWNVKAFFRSLVLSQTYRQSSRVTPELLARDPENRLLARAPRLRLPAELLRDQALALSGLLEERLGGPSVYPYQPEGLYKGIVVGADYPGTKWVESEGGDLFRRSLYTFWKRTIPHPVMVSFDAPDREFCTVRRSRTNTPLQALILMNEPLFLEAARRMGERIRVEGGDDDASRLRWAFRLATAREPMPGELDELFQALGDARRASAASPYPAVAGVLLNLDETITRE